MPASVMAPMSAAQLLRMLPTPGRCRAAPAAAAQSGARRWPVGRPPGRLQQPLTAPVSAAGAGNGSPGKSVEAAAAEKKPGGPMSLFHALSDANANRKLLALSTGAWFAAAALCCRRGLQIC